MIIPGDRETARDPSTVTPWPRDDPEEKMFALVAARTHQRERSGEEHRAEIKEPQRRSEGKMKNMKTKKEDEGERARLQRLASEGAECRAKPDGSGSLIIVITSRGCTSILDHYRPLHIYHLAHKYRLMLPVPPNSHHTPPPNARISSTSTRGIFGYIAALVYTPKEITIATWNVTCCFVIPG